MRRRTVLGVKTISTQRVNLKSRPTKKWRLNPPSLPAHHHSFSVSLFFSSLVHCSYSHSLSFHLNQKVSSPNCQLSHFSNPSAIGSSLILLPLSLQSPNPILISQQWLLKVKDSLGQTSQSGLPWTCSKVSSSMLCPDPNLLNFLSNLSCLSLPLFSHYPRSASRSAQNSNGFQPNSANDASSQDRLVERWCSWFLPRFNPMGLDWSFHKGSCLDVHC